MFVASALNPPQALPVPLTRLIGREQDVEAVSDLLRGDVRLLTLIGTGGVGKTRLAIAVAKSLQDDFPQGVCFVPLAPLNDPQLVIPTIASALGIVEQPDTSLLDTLRSRIGERRLLLVLDNVEHVIEATLDVGRLRIACPNLAILVTSRMPLHLYGEYEYPVPPLILPGGDTVARPGPLMDSDAVALFVERTRAVQPSFTLTDDNAPVIAEICRRLDGLPLAIELAAARMRMFPPSELLARLERPLATLTGGPRDMPSRQQSLRATILWSYELLDEDDQRLFRSVSAFPGGWTLDAAMAVAGTEAETDVLPTLEHLVEQSLVQSAHSPDGQLRYAMLATIREFGLEELGWHGELDEVRQRQARYLLQSLHIPETQQWYGPVCTDWIQRASLEADNVRSVLPWAIGHDSEVAFQICSLFSPYWWTLSRFSEGRRWLERVLSRDRSSSNAARANALLSLGYFATTLGDFSVGQRVATEALGSFRDLNDKRGIAYALHNLGRVAMYTEQHQEAIRHFEEAAPLARESVRDLLPTLLLNLAFAAGANGDLALAQRSIDQGLNIARSLDAAEDIAMLLADKGYLALNAGDLSEARRSLAESLEIYTRQTIADLGAIHALEFFAWLEVLVAHPERSARFLGMVEVARAHIGVPVPPRMQRDYDRYVPQARAQIGAEEWERNWLEGRAMSLAEAIDFALATDEEAGTEAQAPMALLSARETEVLHLLVDGQTNQEIADALFISPRTVAQHLRSIYTKLGVESRTAAATWAVRNGLV